MNDPMTIDPVVWFALICERVATDSQGALSLTRVVSQFRLQKPPEGSGVPPHAHVRGVLMVGLIGGFGDFIADVTLETADEEEIWRLDEPWEFSMAGGTGSNVLGRPFELWLTEPGTYRFWIKVRGRALKFPVRFEVAEQIGPTPVEGPESQ
jgi:hypothetical protein